MYSIHPVASDGCPVYGPGTPYVNVTDFAWLVSADTGINPDAFNEQLDTGTAWTDMWFAMQPLTGMMPVSFYLQIEGQQFGFPPTFDPLTPYSPIPWLTVGGPSPDGVVILAAVEPPLGQPPGSSGTARRAPRRLP